MREKENLTDTGTLTQATEIEVDGSFEKNLQKVRDILAKSNGTDKVGKIKYLSDCLWTSWLRELKFNDLFNQEDRRKMRQAVIFYYLLAWLENDLSSRQTIEEFVNNPYNAEEQNRYDDFEARKNAAKSFRYNEKIYRDNIALQNKQATEEKIRYRRAPYRSIKNNKAVKYDFMALRFMETLQTRQLDIYRLLCLRKERLKTVVPEKKDELIEAYKSYASIPMKLIKETNDRKYVIGCLQFVKFENTYHFLLAAHLVRYMLENNLPPEMVIPMKALISYGRILADENYPDKASDTAFIGGYEKEGKEILAPLAQYEFDKIIIMRGLMERFLQLLFRFFPIDSFGAWTDEEYKSARKFLQENRTLEEFTIFNFKELSKENLLFGNYVRRLYKNPFFMDQSYYAKGHEVLHEKNQKRNRKEPPKGS